MRTHPTHPLPIGLHNWPLFILSTGGHDSDSLLVPRRLPLQMRPAPLRAVRGRLLLAARLCWCCLLRHFGWTVGCCIDDKQHTLVSSIHDDAHRPSARRIGCEAYSYAPQATNCCCVGTCVKKHCAFNRRQIIDEMFSVGKWFKIFKVCKWRKISPTKRKKKMPNDLIRKLNKTDWTDRASGRLSGRRSILFANTRNTDVVLSPSLITFACRSENMSYCIISYIISYHIRDL